MNPYASFTHSRLYGGVVNISQAIKVDISFIERLRLVSWVFHWLHTCMIRFPRTHRNLLWIYHVMSDKWTLYYWDFADCFASWVKLVFGLCWIVCYFSIVKICTSNSYMAPFVLYRIPFFTELLASMAQEEHFVSILNFSWPQVTCVTQCPIRGSRVVFVSFCDKFKQVVFVYHKNKMRFYQLVISSKKWHLTVALLPFKFELWKLFECLCNVYMHRKLCDVFSNGRICMMSLCRSRSLLYVSHSPVTQIRS